MTVPSGPTPATLDAAVEAAARCLWEDVFTYFTGPPIPWASVDEPMVRNGLVADAERLVDAIAPILAAAHADQLAQAHAAGTAAGAAAERERIAGNLRRHAEMLRDARCRSFAGTPLGGSRNARHLARAREVWDKIADALDDQVAAIARAGTSEVPQ